MTLRNDFRCIQHRRGRISSNAMWNHCISGCFVFGHFWRLTDLRYARIAYKGWAHCCDYHVRIYAILWNITELCQKTRLFVHLWPSVCLCLCSQINRTVMRNKINIIDRQVGNYRETEWQLWTYRRLWKERRTNKQLKKDHFWKSNELCVYCCVWSPLPIPRVNVIAISHTEKDMSTIYCVQKLLSQLCLCPITFIYNGTNGKQMQNVWA